MTEIISDPNFTTLGTVSSQWTVVGHQGVVMVPSVKDSVLHLDISKTAGTNWQGELRYSPFRVEKGEIFTVSFSVRAKHPFPFSVWLGQQDAPYKSLVSDNQFGEKMATTEWQIFTHIFKASTNEEKARLNFVLGRIDNLVEIKNISLKKQ